jgi:hypothetical protein
MLSAHALVLTTLLATGQPSQAKTDTLAFAPADVQVLRDIARIKGLSKQASTLFLTAPVAELLTAGSVSAFTVSVLTADFSGVSGAARSMPGIAACAIRDIIAMRLIDDKTPPKPSVARYFGILQDKAETACAGRNRAINN